MKRKVSITQWSARLRLAVAVCVLITVAASLLVPGSASASSDWSEPASIDAGSSLAAVSCPSATFCAAVDDTGHALTYDGTSWSSPVQVQGLIGTDFGGNPVSLSCPTSSFCMAAASNADALDSDSEIFTYNGTSWSVSTGNGDLRIDSLSCLAASFCTTVGWYEDGLGARYTGSRTYKGTSWSGDDEIIEGEQDYPSSMSCPTPTFCAMIDDSGYAATYNGIAWSRPVYVDLNPEAGLNPYPQRFTSVSCASSTFCAAVDNYGGVLTYDGASWSALTMLGAPGSRGYFNSISCPTSTFCAAVDTIGGAFDVATGEVVTYDGTSWSTPSTIDAHGLASVSCPTASFCVAVDGYGNALVYEDSPVTPPSACAAPPTVTSNPADQTVTAPAGASFTAAATNSDANCNALSVQWQVSTDGGSVWANDTTDSANTTGTLTVSPTSVSESGNEYRAVFTNASGQTPSSVARLTVNSPSTPPPACAAPPTVTSNPADQTVTAPAGASFTAAATNSDANCNALSVQWQVSTDGGGVWANDTTDSANTTGTLTVSPTSVSQSGNEYRAVFTNASGQTPSSVATLTVKTAPKPVKPASTALPRVSGRIKVKSRLTATNGSWAGAIPMSYEYQWMSCAGKLRNGKAQRCQAIAGASKSSLILSNQNAGHRLEVVVTAANAAGKASATSHPTGVITK